jgi:hypothetical protein
MTQPAPGADCWLILEAVIFPDMSAVPDTYYGHGVGYGSYPPVDPAQIAPGSARYDALNNTLQVWNGTTWVDQAVNTGDEYVDLDTGVVYALSPVAV